MKKKGETKKPFYKRIWFWILVVIVIIIAMPKGNDSKSESSSTNKTTQVSSNKAGKKSNVSTEFQNSLIKAKSYSSMMHMSKQGIYDQLTSEYGESFSADAAQYAIDNLNANFNKNALKKAKSYSSTEHLSKQGIYDQLSSDAGEKFTADEANYAMQHIND